MKFSIFLMLTGLVFKSWTMIQQKHYVKNVGTFHTRYIGFKRYNDTTFPQDLSTLNSEFTHGIQTPSHCGGECIKTTGCVSFFFKQHSFCRLVGYYVDLHSTNSEQGVFYYEQKNACNGNLNPCDGSGICRPNHQNASLYACEVTTTTTTTTAQVETTTKTTTAQVETTMTTTAQVGTTLTVEEEKFVPNSTVFMELAEFNKEFEVSFQMKPLGPILASGDRKQMFTINGNNNLLIQFNINSDRFQIMFTPLNGDTGRLACTTLRFQDLNIYYTLKANQKMVENVYIFSMYINEQKCLEKTNDAPLVFENVKFTLGGEEGPMNGYIKQFTFTNF